MRPGWGGGKLNALSPLLNPLDAHESETLVGNLLGGRVPEELRLRVADAAEGNPLYVGLPRAPRECAVRSRRGAAEGRKIGRGDHLPRSSAGVYEQKGDLVDAERVQERLAAAGVTPS